MPGAAGLLAVAAVAAGFLRAGLRTAFTFGCLSIAPSSSVATVVTIDEAVVAGRLAFEAGTFLTGAFLTGALLAFAVVAGLALNLDDTFALDLADEGGGLSGGGGVDGGGGGGGGDRGGSGRLPSSCLDSGDICCSSSLELPLELLPLLPLLLLAVLLLLLPLMLRLSTIATTGSCCELSAARPHERKGAVCAGASSHARRATRPRFWRGHWRGPRQYCFPLHNES